MGSPHKHSFALHLFQYGEDEDRKSILLEICWGDQYPNEIPTINLDMFYNRNM